MRSSLAVSSGIELEAEPLAEPPIALRPGIRAGFGDREVDIEENRAKWHQAACSRQIALRRGRDRSARRSRTGVPGVAAPRLSTVIYGPGHLADRRRGIPDRARMEDVHDRGRR